LAVVATAPGMGATRLTAEFARRVALRGATVILGAKDVEVLIETGTNRPVLVVLDGPAAPGPGQPAVLGDEARLREAVGLASRAGRLPVRGLALAGRGAGAATAVEERVLHLGPLAAEHVRMIVASYVGEEDVPAAAESVFASSGGVPERVHADSAAWAK